MNDRPKFTQEDIGKMVNQIMFSLGEEVANIAQDAGVDGPRVQGMTLLSIEAYLFMHYPELMYWAWEQINHLPGSPFATKVMAETATEGALIPTLEKLRELSREIGR